MLRLEFLVPDADAIAVAVSGGADSMALAHALAVRNLKIHAVTVDHALRPESGDEAKQVGAWLSAFPNITHAILRWDGEKPSTRIMEAAREARYALMAAYCREHGIRYLALAHHGDDQAETFLMRLARGSGIDGLAAMREMQAYDDRLMLWRPLLGVTHADLLSYCRANSIAWIEDPTNANAKYTRARLRHARGVLEGEGLSAKRLMATARRMDRASDALRVLACRLAEKTLKVADDDRRVYDLPSLGGEPFELGLRVIRGALNDLGTQGYGPRFEKVENAARQCLFATRRTTLTLGGCILTSDPSRGTLEIRREAAKKGAKILPLAAKSL